MITEFDRIVVIDFETTGTSRDKRAVEVAWFELNKNLEIIDEQASLINPMIPIPWEVIAIHGITDDMVKDSPTLDEFIVDIHEDTFANSSVCVVAHNLSFDLPLFRKYCGNVVELCTLKLARNLYPEFNNHKLSTISERFGFVHEEAHRARSDALQVVHFLALVRETHGMSVFQMIDKTKPKSGKSKAALSVTKKQVKKPTEPKDKDKSVPDLKRNFNEERPQESQSQHSYITSIQDLYGKHVFPYDFTGWSELQLSQLFPQLVELLNKDEIDEFWSGRKLTISCNDETGEWVEESINLLIDEWKDSKLPRADYYQQVFVAEPQKPIGILGRLAGLLSRS